MDIEENVEVGDSRWEEEEVEEGVLDSLDGDEGSMADDDGGC